MSNSGCDNGCDGLLFPLDWVSRMIFWTLMSTILAALAGLAVYIYYFKQGQFDDDSEAVKYQLFHEDDPDG